MQTCYKIMLIIWAFLGLETTSNSFSKDKEKKIMMQDNHGTQFSYHLEKLLRKHSYELSIRPQSKEATIVSIGIDVESRPYLSEKNMDLTFTLWIQQTWRDHRLKYDVKLDNDGIVIPSRLVQKLWVPDIYIVRSKDSYIHSTTVDNTLLRLFSGGNVVYNLKLTATVACEMDFTAFPFDTQSCFLMLQSLGHNSKELVLRWLMGNKTDQHFLDSKLVKSISKFEVTDIKTKSINVSVNRWNPDNGSNSTETKSQLRVEFKMKRFSIVWVTQSYLPAFIMVLIAGLGTLVDANSAPARVSLGVTSVLTISTLITGLKASLPKVSYFTVLDIYLWTCFGFVFLTVVEFCLLNYIMTPTRKLYRQARKLQRRASTLMRRSRSKIPQGDKTSTGQMIVIGNKHKKERLVDTIFLVIYSLAFVIFNFVYWILYIS